MLLSTAKGKLADLQSLLLLCLASTVVGQESTSTCSAVHIILARGRNEPYQGQRQQLLVNATCIALGSTSCDYEDIEYYNTFEAQYCDSLYEGITNGISQITAYNKRCPEAKLVLSGFSQGAQVIGDILGGGGGIFVEGCKQTTTSKLKSSTDAAPGNKIVAALMWGDKRHVASQPYNVLSGLHKDGQFPRSGSQLLALNRFSSILRSYCAITDPNCALGHNVTDHLNYFNNYANDAAEWIRQMVRSADLPKTTTSSATSSPIASADTSTTSPAATSTSTQR
ncbi:Alpha/Beta hydrolase protein [Pseudomassariella vexata]|uniref:Alpha/Beta hydrolase protein n=1 Tax=Pseudomassariella vexata TaxID=1141098 RepID=A0A1Y2EDS7_9PEZI|nr:Alpha/Beta hydrolase protein [Pseudomassariella vexata]ORY69733.1 Alpha/Beta hydrolase protein [Pseudomassariella vexata]